MYQYCRKVTIEKEKGMGVMHSNYGQSTNYSAQMFSGQFQRYSLHITPGHILQVQVTSPLVY